jgi:geranylgeranyl reductase family protein
MKYEVVIVGAGPAGSTAAKFLSEKGINVLLLDKEKFPRNKPCGGGLPIRVFNRFPYIEKNFIDSYSYSAFAYSPSVKYKMKLKRDKPLLATILRKKFDYELVKLAIKAGTKFIDEKSVVDIKITNNSAKVILEDNSKIESEIVIGADGVWSTIAKKTGLIKDYKNICMCLFQEFKLSPKTIDQYLGKDRTCHIHIKVNGTAGYGWVFSKKEHVNIGITDFKKPSEQKKVSKNIKNTYESYLRILKQDKIIPDDLNDEKIRGGALLTRPLNKTYSDRVIICGDAAGFANPVTGEGIYHAMVSGEIAAEVISNALVKGNTREKFLSRYQKKWYKDFGKDLKLLYRLSSLWEKENEKLIDTLCKDEKLTEYSVDAIVGKINARTCRKKMIRRLLYLKLISRFVKKTVD